MKLVTVLLAGMLATGVGYAQEKRLDPQQAVKACSPGMVDDDCIVRHFKDTVEASVIRGRLVYENYCILCHGKEGKGDGRAAKLHDPRPFNLTLSVAPRDYIAQVVRKGGESMNRGKGMPPWGDQLTDEQINDTLNFLWSIRVYK
ncbi:cytochrome c [Niveibacterium sp. 24ML]|uniref:c-type cytochrome n=1 Tax=Niveibacterium sp. 24ML TaxID=2985512 RepID=UPI0022721798|nr:cytochrome c [Niveibacterium sp. 24ML]MCX9157881.1 cytochrome c [Niveibacterium sp. 24ML]